MNCDYLLVSIISFDFANNRKPKAIDQNEQDKEIIFVGVCAGAVGLWSDCASKRLRL